MDHLLLTYFSKTEGQRVVYLFLILMYSCSPYLESTQSEVPGTIQLYEKGSKGHLLTTMAKLKVCLNYVNITCEQDA